MRYRSLNLSKNRLVPLEHSICLAFYAQNALKNIKKNLADYVSTRFFFGADNVT
jgi:hypothetical protein|nr:MAG TPA: hypothetical protein [Inoviridae sp.]